MIVLPFDVYKQADYVSEVLHITHICLIPLNVTNAISRSTLDIYLSSPPKLLRLLHRPSRNLLCNCLLRSRQTSLQHLRGLLLAKRPHSGIVHVREALANAGEVFLVALVVQVLVEIVVDTEFVGLGVKYISFRKFSSLYM